MQIKHNPLVLALLGVLIVIPFLAFMFNDSSESNNENQKVNQPKGSKSSTNDLPAEEVAALTGHMESLEDKLKGISESNANYLEQFKTELMHKVDNELSGKITSVENNQKSVLNNFEELLDKKVEQALSEIATNDIRANEVGNIDSELPFTEQFEIGGADNLQQPSLTDDNSQIVWTYPIGLEPDDKGIIESLSPFSKKATKAMSTLSEEVSISANTLKTNLQPIPFGTIHRDSSIHNATALSSLIGRIEDGGKTHDAYRFQVILSDEVLLANGFDFPEIKDALATGYAVGDAAFSCVKGKITSITFNFEDGRIYNQQGSFEKPLAELSDLWGNPCVKGVRVDDIEKYIAAQSVVGGLGMAGEVVSQNQRTITSSGNSVTTDITGSAGKMVAGSMFSGAANSTSAILAKRYESYYEAVYVPPGMQLSMLFLEDITIDYIPTNRKVRYEENYTSNHSLY